MDQGMQLRFEPTNQMIRTISLHLRRYLILMGPLFFALLLLNVTGCGDAEKGPSKPSKHDSTAASTKADSAEENANGQGDSGLTGSTATAGSPAVGFDNATPLADSAAKYSFGLSPTVGEVYTYRITQRSLSQIDSLKGSDETVYNFRQKVTGINDDGSITVEMVYDSIRFRINAPATPLAPKARTVSFSTQGKLDSTIPGAVQAKALIGKRVNLTIARNGEIREISNIEPIVSAVLGRLRDSLNPREMEQVRLSIKIGGFQSVVQQIYLRSVPAAPVSIGYSWERRDSLPIGGILSLVKAQYRFTEARRVDTETFGHIAVGLRFDFPQKKFDTPQATILLEQAVGSGSGDVVANLRSGFPSRKSTRIEISLRMKATSKGKNGPSGVAGESQTMSQRSIQNSLVELLNYQRGS